MRKMLIMLPLLLLGACASPTFQMSPEQVSTLTDDQLCSFKNNYRNETKLELEIGRRGLNCNRFYRECLNRGNQPGTQAMAFCMDLVRENERLRYDPPYDQFGMFGYNDYYRMHGRHRH